MAQERPANDDRPMADSYSVDLTALGTVPRHLDSARDVLSGISVAAASAEADLASGGAGIGQFCTVLDNFLSKAAATISADAARLHQTSAGYGAVEQAVVGGTAAVAKRLR
jgi:hypothetical protein